MIRTLICAFGAYSNIISVSPKKWTYLNNVLKVSDSRFFLHGFHFAGDLVSFRLNFVYNYKVILRRNNIPSKVVFSIVPWLSIYQQKRHKNRSGDPDNLSILNLGV